MGTPRDFVVTLLLENLQPRTQRGAWHGGPTAAGSLRGVSGKQAVWSPAPGRKSIWALTLHIAYWKYAVRRRLEGGEGERFPRSPANWPLVPPTPDARAWKADIDLLRTEHDLLVSTVSAIAVSDYSKRVSGGKRWSFGELIVGIAQHDAYHTGQIQMLKRLWKSRGS